jgi:hypothetical protein
MQEAVTSQAEAATALLASINRLRSNRSVLVHKIRRR